MQETSTEKTTLLTRDFVAASVGQFFAFTASGLTGPVFPLYMASLGFTESMTGLYLAAFSIVSFLVRPFYGGLSDKGQPRKALDIAGLLTTVGQAAYLTANPVVMLIARTVHGAGWAGVNVAGSAWVAYLAPAAQRAEALGYYTMVQRVGIAIGPVAGLWLVNNIGFFPAFAAAAMLSFCVLLSTRIATTPDRETPPVASTPPPTGTWLRRVIEPEALLGAGLLVVNVLPNISVSAFMPLYFQSAGFEGIECYFLALGIIGIVSRGATGKMADRLGRKWSIIYGFALQLLGLLAIAVAPNVPLITVGGMIFIVGSAVCQPSLYALAIDRALPNRRGAAMSTYTMAFQVGNGFGSAIGGVIAEHLGFIALNWFSALTAIFALAVAAIVTRRW